MCKNHRISVRVDIDTKTALERKAKLYGGMTRFLEDIAKKDIILVDKEIAALLKGGKNNIRP